MNNTEAEQLASQLEGNENFKVLRKLNPDALYRLESLDGTARDIGTAIVLDTETTGRNPATDRIIELGMVIFAYDRKSLEVLSVLDAFNALEDPGMPIPLEATQINGITDEMVQGQRIDDMKVQELVSSTDVVIAHNASFDRVFCENRFPFFKDKAWACSVAQVDWQARGIGSAKLEYLAYCAGFFYDAHRAEMDCMALLKVLDTPISGAKERPLVELLQNCGKEQRCIWAVGAPYSAKDILKARNYRWSDGTGRTEKAWHIAVDAGSLDEELDWLSQNVFGNRPFSVPTDRIDAFSRFSERRNPAERVWRG